MQNVCLIAVLWPQYDGMLSVEAQEKFDPCQEWFQCVNIFVDFINSRVCVHKRE